MKGRVVLVGAGPGDPDLLTVRALRELERADVLLYDALISEPILSLARPQAERVDVGKRGDGTRGVSQERIAALMIEHARRGSYVVRLKGGDPFVFGRGGEEASALVEAGVPFEVVPGISSALAVPAYAGIPLTDRRWSSSFTVVTGHRGKLSEDDRTDWEGLARSSETLVVLMGTAWIEDITARVVRGGRAPETPAVVISHGTTGRQRSVRAPLRQLAEAARRASIGPPAVMVIGRVAAMGESLRWYERRPLFGRRVLTLRAREAEDPLGVALCAAGAVPVCVPLLEFVPPRDSGRELYAALAGLDRVDWLVLTSATTLRFLSEAIDRVRRAEQAGSLRIACIGGATARAARANGLRVDRVPEGAAGPEALLDALGAVCGQTVLIPRSEQAGDALPDALARRGARVVCATAYRNVLPTGAARALDRAFEEGVDAVLLASPSSIERMLQLRDESEIRALAERVPFVCIGATTAEALRRAGVRVAAVARRTRLDGLVEELERYYAGQDAEVAHGIP